MNEMRPSERVYRTPELFQSILDFLDRDGIARMSPICRDFQKWVGKRLYRHLRFDSFDDLLRKRKFWTDEYCAQVQYVDANQMEVRSRGVSTRIVIDPDPRRSYDVISGPALRHIQQRCPSLRLIYQNSNYWDHLDKWQVQFGSSGEITLYQRRDAHFWLDREIIRGSVLVEDPQSEKDMTGINMAITLGIIDGRRDSAWPQKDIPDAMNRYREWLIEADDLPHNVTRLHLLEMPVSLDQVGEMCCNRFKHGGRHLEEIRVDSLDPFDLTTFERFLNQTGQQLRTLILSHIQQEAYPRTRTPLLHLNDLSRVVDLVKEKCPKLERLELYFTGASGGSVVLDEVVPISQSSYDGQLRFVGVHLHNDRWGEYDSDTPLFSLARNMACLGGSTCYYETRLIDNDEREGTRLNDNSGELASLIAYLRHKCRESHAEGKFRDLDLSGPEWKQLPEMEYETDGQPINRNESIFRRSYVMALAAVEVSNRSMKAYQRYWDDNGLFDMDIAKLVQSIRRSARAEQAIAKHNLIEHDVILATTGFARDFQGLGTRVIAQTEELWKACASLPVPMKRSSRRVFFGSLLPDWPGSEIWPPSFLDSEGTPRFRSRRLELSYESGQFPEEMEGWIGELKGWEMKPDEDDSFMMRVRSMY